MSGVVYCGCGHTADEHPAGGPCVHRNAGRKFPRPAPCACRRLDLDARLTDSDDFVGKVVEKARAAMGWQLEPVEREEAEQVLRISLWKTAQKYDSRSHVRFRVYAYLELYNDAIDHIRAERGRHGEKRVHDPNRGLNDLAELAGVGDGSARADRLDGAASHDPADDPDTWAADAGGLLTVRDSLEARVAGEPRQRRRRRDAGSDPRAVLGHDRHPRAEDRNARGDPQRLKGAA